MAKVSAANSVQNWLDRLVAVLRRRAGKHLAEAERAAGVSPGYLRKAQSASGNVMLRNFLRICAAADIDPAEVFAEVFPQTGNDPDLGLVVPNIPLPKIAKEALKRLNEYPQHPTVGVEWLDWLNELRYDDPNRVTRIAEESVMSVELRHIPVLLGIWASACRLLCRHDESFLVIREALRLARKNGDALAEGTLLRRGASLVAATSANYAAALRILDRSCALFAQCGAFDRLAGALVSQGMFLYYLEQFAQVERSLESALDLMRPENRRDRVVAYQLLGLVAQSRQEFHLALEHTSNALELTVSRYEVGKLCWMKGCIQAEIGRWDLADKNFTKATDALLTPSPEDAALCSCDHVRLLVSRGRILEAQGKAQAMRRLMEPLAHNLVASMAVRDLIRSEQEGTRLTTVLVARITKRIEESKRSSRTSRN